MKIQVLLSSVLILLATLFIACDDDISSIGSTITPGGDLIKVGSDTVLLTARTIHLNDSVYAKATAALLGEYSDDLFGTINSDFMSEFYSPEEIKFKDRTYAIDSVDFSFLGFNYVGDTTRLMGINIFELNKPLDKYYFTNADPSKYCDMKKPLAQGAYIYEDAVSLGNGYKQVMAKADTLLGKRFFDEWKNNPETFKDAKKFKAFFPGVYVTTNYGSDGLLSISSSNMNIYYKYKIRNHDNTSDSTLRSVFQLYVTDDVVQLNRVENKYTEGAEFDDIFNSNPERAYLKTPAGVATEIEIPLREIMRNVGTDKNINSATFTLKGIKKEEEKSKLGRPTNLLFINKDSLENFFVDRKLENNVTSYLMQRTAGGTPESNNTYYFGLTGLNLSRLVEHYIKLYKDENIDNVPNLKYVLIPVDRMYEDLGQGATRTTALYNVMRPTSAIFLTNEKNMKFSVVYAKY